MKYDTKQMIANMTSDQLKLQVWVTQILLFVVSIPLAFWLFTSWNEIQNLFAGKTIDIFIYGVPIAGMVVVVDAIMMNLLPTHLWDDGGINQKVFEAGSYVHFFLLCLSVAIVEEWLFRGVLQSNTNLLVASLLFALIHIRYIDKLFLLISVVGLSFLLGGIFLITSHLLVVIVTHFIIDFGLALLIRSGRVYYARS
ncbi:CAAX amino terminal protease family protein [Gracilibacillus halophilus YIM-C55.5]|uniref:CAAX amino terminal protease family protein n=1 Tax=Gracilibacillus halophilus YIM-C55.5 TaxID=1308866 RepID=N4WSK3_9BACI|nr:CPBP family intramembrane glutamic endopeptidase [Gracilibacillus halophilus]ENH97365.1 CAAX amino terminal protease family protein [Gracilibacillus halophilus YIM-C55.5]